MIKAKKFIGLVLTVLLICSVMVVPLTASAQENGDYTYELIIKIHRDRGQEEDPPTVKITGYNGSQRDPIIPSTLEGFPVEYIGSYAFSDNKLITSVTIPNSVSTIYGFAFSGCTDLKTVYLSNSVYKIVDAAFYRCGSLTDVYYSGSEADWNDINILTENDCLKNANIHFNSKLPTEPSTQKPTEAVVTQPVTEATTAEPDTTAPSTQEPTETVEPQPVTEATTAKPDMSEPVTSEPVTTEPATTEPVTDKPTETSSTESVEKPTEATPVKPETSEKKDNPIKVTAKAKTIKLKKLKKKNQTIKAITVKNAKGKVSYKLTGVPKKLGKLVKINSKGVITFKKWKTAKKGTYKLYVTVSAKGNSKYKPAANTVKVSIKVK